MAIIPWADKVTNQTSPLPAINKLTAADMNVVKAVVNAIIQNTGLLKSDGTTVSAETFLVIDDDGAWEVNGDLGNSGQALLSQGPGAPALWGDIPASPIPTGNIVWVDIINGNNGTAIVGRQDKPFATPAAAKTAATSGSLIHVLPGTYNITTSLAKTGVNWYLEPGVIFENVTNGLAVFDDGGAAMEFSVTGYGQFLIDPPAASTLVNVLRTANAGTVVSFQGKSATNLGANTAVNTCNLVRVGGGQVEVEGLFLLATDSAGASPVVASGGVLRMTGVRVDTEDIVGVSPITANATIIMHQCTLVADAGDESIASTGPVSITSYGSYANTDTGSDVTIFGSLTTGSYVS